MQLPKYKKVKFKKVFFYRRFPIAKWYAIFGVRYSMQAASFIATITGYIARRNGRV